MNAERSKELTKIVEKLYNIFYDDKHYHFANSKFAINVTVYHYIEEYTQFEEDRYNKKIRSVEERDPLKERFNPRVVAFRYYDTKEIEIEDEVFVTKKHNFSKKVYLGQRLTVEEILSNNLIDKNFLSRVDITNIKDPSSMIVCNNGILITSSEEDAITFEELQQLYEHKKVYKRSIDF